MRMGSREVRMMEKLDYILGIIALIFMLIAVWNNNYTEAIFWLLITILNRVTSI